MASTLWESKPSVLIQTYEVGGTLTVRAKKTILAAGAIGTPKLLWVCGLAEKIAL